jgi:hypothetical protein
VEEFGVYGGVAMSLMRLLFLVCLTLGNVTRLELQLGAPPNEIFGLISSPRLAYNLETGNTFRIEVRII